MAVSTSSKGADPRRQAGFTLFEALVALVVAGLLLPTLGRALAQAWSASRTPLEIVSAIALARDTAADLGPVAARGYRVARSSAAIGIEVRASDIPPAPARSKDGKDQNGLNPDAVPASMRLAIPASFNAAPPGSGPAPPAALVLRHVSVVVTTPSGRRIGFDSLKLDAPQP